VLQQPVAQRVNRDKAAGPDLQTLQVSAGDRVIDRGAANPSKAAGFGWRYCENPYIRGCDRVRLPHFSSIVARTLANEGELADKWLLKKDCSISSSFERASTFAGKSPNPVEGERRGVSVGRRSPVETVRSEEWP